MGQFEFPLLLDCTGANLGFIPPRHSAAAEERNQHGAREPMQATTQQVGRQWKQPTHTLDEGFQDVSLAEKISVSRMHETVSGVWIRR